MAITIAIPFYNAERYLPDAIRSVFAQTFQDWELILIDDGSTDRSLEIAKSINDPRVRVYSDGKNRKLAARLNEINGLARHEFIARMDADDLMSPDRLRIQFDFLRNNPNVDVMSTGLYSVLDDGTLVGWRGSDNSHISFQDLLDKRKSLLHAGLLARKSWYARNQYDEASSGVEDIDLWFRASKKNDFKAMTISKPLYIYREEGNVTVAKMLRSYHLERAVLSRHIDSWRMRGKYLAKSYAKSAAITVLDKVGCLGFLQKNRNQAPNDTRIIAEYESIIDRIKSIKVPGLPSEPFTGNPPYTPAAESCK